MEAERTLALQNNERRPVTVHVRKQGRISDYLQVDTRKQRLEPGEQLNLSVRLKTTDTVTAGNYTGAVVVARERPLWKTLW